VLPLEEARGGVQGSLYVISYASVVMSWKEDEEKEENNCISICNYLRIKGIIT
jgi:hypothetical protein